MATCLSDRDLNILLQIHDKVSPTVTHIQRLCFDGLSRDSVYKSLVRLERRGFIKRSRYDFGRTGKLEDLLFLTKAGHDRLLRSGLITGSYLRKTAPDLVIDYAHRTAIIDYWISLELDITRDPRFELALFVPEFKKLDTGRSITLKAELPNGETLQVRNDALFIIRNTVSGMEHLFLLEIDRGTMPLRVGKRIESATANNQAIRSNLSTKVEKIQNVFDHWEVAIASLGERFGHFQGARVVVATETPRRMLSMLGSLPIRAPYLELGVFSSAISSGAGGSGARSEN